MYASFFVFSFINVDKTVFSHHTGNPLVSAKRIGGVRDKTMNGSLFNMNYDFTMNGSRKSKPPSYLCQRDVFIVNSNFCILQLNVYTQLQHATC